MTRITSTSSAPAGRLARLWRPVLGRLAHLPLRSKLILAFLVVAVLSIGAVTLTVNQVIRTGLTNQVGAGLHSLAQVKGQQIAALLDQQVAALEAFALSPIFRDAVEGSGKRLDSDPAVVQEKLRQMDLQWDLLADNDPLIAGVLGHRTSSDLREFQGHFPGFSEVLVTNQAGELVGANQRPVDYSYTDEAWWQAAYNQGQGAIYIGQPEFNNQISSFGMVVAMPVRSRFAEQRGIGVLRGLYNLGALTDGLRQARFGQSGHVDLLLPDGQLLSAGGQLERPEPEFIEQLNRLADQPYVELALHQAEAPALASQALVQDPEARDARAIQQLGWKLIAEQEAVEALAPVDQAIQIALWVSLAALVLAGLLALLIAQPLTAPIARLTSVAAQVAGGDLSVQAQVESGDEIGRLAGTFNTMTQRLRQTLTDLERRSQGLETVAGLSERLSAILNLDELLAEVVQRVKEDFGYYHTQIYLLDDTGQSLNLASATGEAGQMMLARQHRLPLGKGLVGRAAASNSVVLAPNLSRAILPEVVTAANVELALQRAADPTIQTRWYGDYLSRTFVEFNRLATASTQARPLKLGYVLHFWGDFTAEIQRGAEDAARDLGLEIEVVAPPYGDKAEAVNLFEQLVKAGKDGLVVIPELEEPWPGPFERAAQAGIPVVTANSTGPNLAAWPWFGQDGYQSGFTLADEFKKFLLAAGHTGGTIVVGACTTAEVVISARYEGFKKGLENSGFTLTPLYETGLDPAVNRQSWAELVPAWPDLVAAVGLSAPDIPSLARIKKQTNAPWLIAGYDLVVETLETIEAGLVQVAIGQHPYLQGYLPVLALAQHLRQGQPLQNWMVEGWLPNPLLPETKAEVAVPITLEGRVVGVLDVQADKVGALDESDANILRSLANQIAVAVRNARLFEEVQTALAEARELQQRYVEQAWDKTRLARHNVRRAQFSLGESTALSEATIAQARQQALSHPQPVVVPLNGGGSPNSADTFNVQPSTLQTLVSPISLRGVPIGSLQLYESSPERQWTEPELDLINAVIDQVAQAAENLRLLDESQERASREQLISYISNKMRRATDLENLMEVTVTELARVLEPARTFVHLNLNE